MKNMNPSLMYGYKKFDVQMSYREYRKIKNNPLSVIPMYMDKIEKIMVENIEFGQHLYDEIFIPEYIGFKEELENNEKGITRFYTKDKAILFRNRHNDNWMFKTPIMNGFAELKIANMFVGIITLESFGVDVSIIRYIDGEWVK